MYTRNILIPPYAALTEYVPYGEVNVDVVVHSDGVVPDDPVTDVHIDDSRGHEAALSIGKERKDVSRESDRTVNAALVPNTQYEDWEVTINGLTGDGTAAAARAWLSDALGDLIELELTKQNPDTTSADQLGTPSRPINAVVDGWTYNVANLNNSVLQTEAVHRAYYARKQMRMQGPALIFTNNNPFPVRAILEITMIDIDRFKS